MPLNARRVPEKPVLRTEYSFRTGKAYFLHRMLLKTLRVPQEAVLRTECQFRTVGGRFRYRMHIPCTPNPLYRVRWKTLCIAAISLTLSQGFSTFHDIDVFRYSVAEISGQVENPVYRCHLAYSVTGVFYFSRY